MTDEYISPLRRRMIEDMTVRNFVAKTQTDYIRRVKNFAVFLGRSPGDAIEDDVEKMDDPATSPTATAGGRLMSYFSQLKIAATPSSTGISAPLIQPLASLNRKITAWATTSGSAIRGVLAAISAPRSPDAACAARNNGVSVRPGLTQLNRIPRPADDAAISSVQTINVSLDSL